MISSTAPVAKRASSKKALPKSTAPNQGQSTSAAVANPAKTHEQIEACITDLKSILAYKNRVAAKKPVEPARS